MKAFDDKRFKELLKAMPNLNCTDDEGDHEQLIEFEFEGSNDWSVWFEYRVAITGKAAFEPWNDTRESVIEHFKEFTIAKEMDGLELTAKQQMEILKYFNVETLYDTEWRQIAYRPR